jgi:hypothetical protein
MQELAIGACVSPVCVVALSALRTISIRSPKVLPDAASIFDNSDAALTLIAERTRGWSFVIHDAARWSAIERAPNVKEMTDRELLDAIRRGLEKTSRRFAKGQATNGRLEPTRPQTAEQENIATGHESADAPREKTKL